MREGWDMRGRKQRRENLNWATPFLATILPPFLATILLPEVFNPNFFLAPLVLLSREEHINLVCFADMNYGS